VETSHNKQLSEMPVGVEVGSLLLPMTLCGSSGGGAPNPPHRQAAGRYMPYALLRWNTIISFLILLAMCKFHKVRGDVEC